MSLTPIVCSLAPALHPIASGAETGRPIGMAGEIALLVFPESGSEQQHQWLRRSHRYGHVALEAHVLGGKPRMGTAPDPMERCLSDPGRKGSIIVLTCTAGKHARRGWHGCCLTGDLGLPLDPLGDV